MGSKKLFQDPSTCVQDMLDGIKATYPALVVNSQLGLAFLNSDRGNKVALFSGGGSGHEPFPAGYIANNMLTGSVSGLVFTSPPVSNVFSGIHFLSRLNRGGVLVIIMNYTGDQLNFGLAIEHAKSRGIKVESISVNDDCAMLGHEALSLIGKRGICGCSVTFKLLGSLSESGMGLSEIVKEYNDEILPRLASMGACLQPCTLPASDDPLFGLGSREISLGCGVHGEAGIATIQVCPLKDLVNRVLTMISDTGILKYGNQVCVLVGNLGSTTQMECFTVAKEVKDQLREKGIVIERLYVGTLMSSLDMKGFQVSLLNTTGKEKWLDYLDSPTEAFGWPGTQLSVGESVKEPEVPLLSHFSNEQYDGMRLSNSEARLFRACLVEACTAVKERVSEINLLDSECGDGDCGSTLASLAEGILERRDLLPWNKVGQTLGELSQIAECKMGGTSGAVYSLLLQGAAWSANSWPEAWTSALETLYKYSPARVGHRTLVDALAPACEAYCSHVSEKGANSWEEALELAVQKAKNGCTSTRTLKPKLGRACYAESSRVTSEDAGAYGTVIWLNAIAGVLLGKKF